MRVRAVTPALCSMLVAGLSATLVASVAPAETIIVNDQVAVAQSNIARPMRGMHMAQVEQQFGAPTTKHPAVGGGSPHRPPITRWDYPTFSVFFEHDIVLHSVVTGDQSSGGADHPAGDGQSQPAEHPAAGGDHPADATSAAVGDHPVASTDH
jgi:hypothetical protein